MVYPLTDPLKLTLCMNTKVKKKNHIVLVILRSVDGKIDP